MQRQNQSGDFGIMDVGYFDYILDICSVDFATFKKVFGLSQNNPYELIRIWNGGM